MSEKISAANVQHFPIGQVEISPRAIASIAAATATQTYGVVGMAPHNLRDNIVQVLRPEDQYKGIEIQCRVADIVIDLYVVVEYGTRIATVARNVMQNVKYAAERALGLPVAAVNVHVQGLRIGDRRPASRQVGG